MSANIQPYKDAIKLLTDAVMDSLAASSANGNTQVILTTFLNVLSDLLVLLPELSQMPAPSSLADSDYVQLVAALSADLVLPGKPGAVLEASMKLLSDMVSVMVPDLLAISAAAKS